MKTEDWTATHLGKQVKIKGYDDDWVYRLEGLSYDYGSNGVTATLVTIVPSPRPGVVGHYQLESIELLE